MRRLAAVAVFIISAMPCFAQSVLGRNLVVNGDAEAGPAATSLTTTVASIPGWTRTGNANVIGYNAAGLLQVTQPSPPDHGFQYFVAGNGVSALSQDIDVSSGSAAFGTGNVKFTATAFLGTFSANSPLQLAFAFKNAAGQTFSTATLSAPVYGAVTTVGYLFRQREIGLVPPGTARITVTLSFPTQAGSRYPAADSLSLVLEPLGTAAAAVLGPNLLANPGAEEGPSAVFPTNTTDIPGWSTSGSSVAPYGGSGWIGTASPGPSTRGVNIFTGDNTSMYQDLDVSPAASMVDAGKVTYQLSAWLGALNGAKTPTLTYTFFDWSGKQLAPTAQLGPVAHSGTGLVAASQSGVLPAGTRRIHFAVNFPNNVVGQTALADELSFTLSPAGAPAIAPAGIVPVYSTSTTIQPGSWCSIYGTNLASATSVWGGDFPTMLGGVTVTVNSKPAYLWFVSPTQINFQAPDDTATGTVNVTVTTQSGSATSTVTLGSVGPSFSVVGGKYAAAYVVVAPPSTGNTGAGYDLIGPAGGLPFTTRPAKAGETLVLFGIGFGSTTPPVPAGAVYAGAAQATETPVITIGGVSAKVQFAGIVGAGLFQFNVTVPAAGIGDKLLQAMVGGVTTPGNVFVTLQ